MIIFSAFFALIIYFISIFFGGILGLGLGIIIIVLYALFAYFLGDKIVLKISNAQEADRKQYNDLYSVVEGLAAATQIPTPKVYIINDPNPNAFATGRNKKLASIAVTTGLLGMMDRHELEGVISHEISHVADNDIKLMMLVMVYAGAIGIFAAFLRNWAFWGFGRSERNGGLIVLIAFVIGLLAPLFALLIRLAISRRREYMADANGARITRDPGSLASALTKIQKYSSAPNAQPVRHANEITASLYFANPFNAKSIMNIFSTHPPIEERINRLKKMY